MSSSLSKNANYPAGLSGLYKSDGTKITATPATGQSSGVTATVKQYGPNLSETQGNLTDTTQQSATTLTCDSTAMSSDEANQVKNSQNYGPGETSHAVESPGTGQAGATTGQPAGYSILGS